MKKILKKAVALILTAAMSLSICLVSFASVDSDITVPGGDSDITVSGGGGGGFSLSYGNAVKEEEKEPFIDVEPDDWFYDYVVYVYQNGYMSGTSDTEFSPYNSLTRGMVASILYRMAGSPAVEYEKLFDDLEDGQWYTDGMIWAVQEGIIAGYGDGTCGPEKLVTVEQLASILYRHAGYPETDNEALSKKAVYGNISDYAYSAMEWAAENGMLYGEPVRPGYPATRAEAAMMFAKFDQM